MKTQIAILLIGSVVCGWAQDNFVVFRNGGVAFETPADRLVYLDHVGGVRLVGTSYVAGLWFVPGNDATSVDGRISPERGVQAGINCPFRVLGTAVPGTWLIPTGTSPSFTLNGANIGELTTLQVRVWDVTKFPTFANAFDAGEFGASEPFSYTVPPVGSAPSSYYMDNLRAFSMVVDSRTLSVDDLVVAEGSNGVFQANFTLRLHQAQTEPVSVDYATQDGTALGSSDYLATNGTVTFAPGEISKTVSIVLVADGPAEEDEMFYLNLTNAVNGRIGKAQGSCTITEVRVVGLSVDTTISFNTVVNHRYVVERSNNTIDWEPVAGATNMLGTGGVISIVDRGSGCQTMRAYRARLMTD